MRKSFTRLCSFLVLLLLSVQMALAAPTLVTGGLSPVDGGIVNPVNPVFTLTFKAAVQPGEFQIIGLYNSLGVETKAIQLKNGSTVGGVTTFTHPDGVVTFNGNVVTLRFSGVSWQQKANYWITVGASAIKDGSGNFNAAAADAFGAYGNPLRWEFTIQDVVAPIAKTLYPADQPPIKLVETQYNQSGTPGNLSFAIKFSEDVQFTPGYVMASGNRPVFGDFAIYTSSDNRNTSYQEGGDLITLLSPYLYYYDDGAPVTYPAKFDSLVIDWTRPSLPSNTDLYVRVKPNIIQDMASPVVNLFAGMNNEDAWNFTTKDDEFNAPTITVEGPAPACAGLESDDHFLVDFDDSEVLHFANNGNVIADGYDMKAFMSITDAQGDNIPIKTAKLNTSTNTFDVIPLNILVSTDLSFKVKIDAGCIKDASGNLSKGKDATFYAGNWNAPIAYNQKIMNHGGTTLDFRIWTNEPCAIHYIVVRKDRAYKPTTAEVFGMAKGPGHATLVDATSDVFYRFNESTVGYSPLVDDSKFLSEGNLDLYYGRQTAVSPAKYDIVEVFAQGDRIIPNDSVETQISITGLPATHGLEDSPAARYEIYYVLIDTICTQGAYATDWWVRSTEHISAVQEFSDATVYTTDILMPVAWFDGDSSHVTPGWGKLNPDKLLPANVYDPAVYDPLGTLVKDGNIYINFNQPIRKENGLQFSSNPATLSTELKACLWVYEGATMPGVNRNADTGWSTNYGYTASLSADKKQIIIDPDSSWTSEGTVWVKIRNSKIEDSSGNEIVPYNDLYTQEYEVESYIPPLVRYTFGSIWNPLDSMLDVPYKINHNSTVASITVTVSQHIFVYPGCNLESGIVAPGVLVPFSNDTTKLAYIGNFFKIRKGDDTTVTESTSDELESDFIFHIEDKADSTLITITPTKQYDSEIWYFIQMDGRIQDENLRTIDQGAAVNSDSDRPEAFDLDDALTGNATIPGWISGNPATDDNKTAVFKTEDSRNPQLFFYSKKQSTLLSDLEDLDKEDDIVPSDTIGVYIDEYVSLGFDHYIHFDALSSTYTLDANAMRRYFKVWKLNSATDSTLMDFDVVGLDTHALLNDSLIFYIDPYYVGTDGTALVGTEGENFKKASCYRVHFISLDPDDSGIEAFAGKEKGIYWDDNNNLVLVQSAKFCTITDPTPECVAATILPVVIPGTNTLPSTQFISVGFGALNAELPLPFIQIAEGTSSVYTVTGQYRNGLHNTVYFNVKDSIPGGLKGDSTYTVTIGSSVDGSISLTTATGSLGWPANACIHAIADSVWTYKMVDATAPALDTLPYIVHSPAIDAAKYPTYLIPRDDSVGYSMTNDLVMVFTEEVILNNNKRLTVYDSNNDTKGYALAQWCHYGTHADKTQDQHVVIVPAGYFTLKYNTNYHVSCDKGFVTDKSPLKNEWEGILVADGNASGGPEDLLHDWSFRTGSDPAPFFTLFNPANGTIAVDSKLAVTFSEAVNPVDNGGGEIKIFEVRNGLPKIIRATLNVTNTAQVEKLAANVYSLKGFTPVWGRQYCVSILAASFEDSNNAPLAWGCDTTGIYYNTATPDDDQTFEGSIAVPAATWFVDYRDDVPPSVINNWPRNGAKHVPFRAYSYIEFNEPVALSDGSAIIPDPNLLIQTIDNFITVTYGSPAVTLDPDQYDVEFVGNNKKLLRITMLDELGYAYNPASGQPAMQDYTNYTINLANWDGTNYLADVNNNLMAAGTSFSFLTEDVTPPVISNPTVTVEKCTNKFDFTYDVTEESDTIRLYYAILPTTSKHTPTADELYAQVVPDAFKVGIEGGDGGAAGVDFTVDMGNWLENPTFKMYAVARDCETDIWINPTAAWDSLFFFHPEESYGELYDRIRDIKLAPNKSMTVVPTGSFMIWDDDAPGLKGSYPLIAQLQVPVDANMSFWFKEAVMEGNVAGMPDTIYLRRYDNNVAVAATVTWPLTGTHADSILVINPTVNLDQETKYYIEFDRYAIQDEDDVCPGHDNVYYPQMVGRGYWFKTQDNKGPRWVSNSPANGEKCVSCPDLNADGADFITVDFYESNEVKVAANAADPFVYLYRAEENVVPVVAWDVIPAGEITVTCDKNASNPTGVDTLWHVNIPLHHQYYPNDTIEVQFPAGLVVDTYDNKFTYAGISQKIVWKYVTCNTEAPEVTWAVHSLAPFFNYSAEGIEDGIYGDWTTNYMTGVKKAVVTGVPTHIALKIDFGEEVEFNTGTTATPKWELLSDYVASGTAGLTQAELFSIIKVGDLKYTTTIKQDTILNVSGNTVTIGFLYTPGAEKLPVNTLLAEAQANGNIGPITAPAYLQDFYDASLISEKEYKVTVGAEKIRATENCVKGKGPRFVETDIVTLNTRNDLPPTVDFTNEAGKSLCESNECIERKEVITVHFSDPVVKSSYDVSWLGEESFTFDNLPLNASNLKTVDGHYLEFYKVSKSGSVYTRISQVPTTLVALDAAKQNYKIQPVDNLEDETWYELVFKPFTVKKFIENDANGTIYEGGDTCRFRVGDHTNPLVDVTADAGSFLNGLNPSNGNINVSSDIENLYVVFNEAVKLGSGSMWVRSEIGAIINSYTTSQVTLQNKNSANADTLVIPLTVGLKEFTRYYVEMEKGFITDVSDPCTNNDFAGFFHRLDPNTGELLSADWSFKTTDASPPELIHLEDFDQNLNNDTIRSPFALFPQVGDTVSKNSPLVMIFDENIHIHSFDPFITNNGIVIYHDNGNTPGVNFGNAVEYISWQNQDHQIEISGTDIYNGLTANVITINPETVFDSKGIYYVRVVGDNIFDEGENSWKQSTHDQIDPINDHEWWFTIANDVAPVLVATTPTYAGVSAPRVYADAVPTGDGDHGYVKTTLSMTFYDNTIANGGQPLKVVRGDASRYIRIFEYTYDAVAAQFKPKPWITLPITDPSVEFNNNIVTIKDVMLRDGIRGGTNFIKDSVYYVTVDPGAVLNGYPESSTWWPGINNGDRWRFTTPKDVVFVGQEDIISPNIAADADAAKDLTIAGASTLEVKFGESIKAINNPTAFVQIFKSEGNVKVDEIAVTKSMIIGANLNTLRMTTNKLVDETHYYVQIQAGAFTDTSLVPSNPNKAFGGKGVWEFWTGDNTAPKDTLRTPTLGCVGAIDTLVLYYKENNGVTKGAGLLTIKDSKGKEWASVPAENILIIGEAKNIVKVPVAGLPDTTLLTVTVPAGFINDLGNNALPNALINDWTFTTGENTAPTAVITPTEVKTPTAVISIEFSEKVLPKEGAVNVGDRPIDVALFATLDSVTYTYTIDSLLSETTYAIVMEAGAFGDLSACGSNLVAETTGSFVVGDIIAPLASGSPKSASDYKGLKLIITFTDAVTPAATGDVVIYDAKTDLPIETIAADSSVLVASEGNTVYTFAPSKVKFGQYYIKIDAGAFVDLSAAPIAQACPGISSKTAWPLSIVDPSFDCSNPDIISPKRAATNVPVKTTVEISFCEERIAAGTGIITIADQSQDRVPGVNYFEYTVTADMISGNKLTIPVEGLQEITTYSIIIPTGAITDEAGNSFIGITDANFWIFTTGDFTAPTVTVNTATILNDGTGEAAITSSELGIVFLAKNDVAANYAALTNAIAAKKAVVATVTEAGVAVVVNAKDLDPGIYKAYAFDKTRTTEFPDGRMGTAVNVVTIEAIPIVPYYAIKAIQGEAAASPLITKKVRTNGTVTLVVSNGFYMQDANAAWSGIFVSTTDKTVGKGSGVEVIGTVAEVDGLTTIQSEAIGFIAPVIDPSPITIGPAVSIAEMHESVLVKVTGRPAVGGTVSADWTIASVAKTNYTINNAVFGSYPVLQDNNHEVEGIGTSTNKVLAIKITNLSKLNGKLDLSNEVKVYPNPFDKYITLAVSNDVVITKAVITNIAGQLVKEVINPNNTIPTSELRSGVYFISLHTVDGIAKTERIIKR